MKTNKSRNTILDYNHKENIVRQVIHNTEKKSAER